MRGLPDSAVIGTYKRAKRIGKPRRVRKSHKDTADFMLDVFVAMFGNKNKKGRK